MCRKDLRKKNGKIGEKCENRKIRGNGKLENKKGKIGGYLTKGDKPYEIQGHT